jgi:prepilin peptidase CpaA
VPVFSGTPLGAIAGTIYTLLLVVAAVSDLRTRRIPNTLVVGLAVIGLGFSVLHAPLAEGALRGGGGLAVGLILWLPFYVLGWLGAGDVKMFAAAGSWLGPVRTLESAAIAALVGAVLAVVWMVRNHGAKRAIETVWLATAAPTLVVGSTDSARAARSLPYGVALAVGALVGAWAPAL